MIHRSKIPTFGGVAVGAGCSKQTVVFIILGVAVETILRCGCEVTHGSRAYMAGAAGNLSVFANQMKRNQVMVEVSTVRIYSVVAGRAVRPKRDEVLGGKGLIHSKVAIGTNDLIHGSDIALRMTICAGKWQAA